MKTLPMRANTTNGLLFTFCGLDGCGKTTMLQKLCADPEFTFPIFVTKQPTDAVRRSDIFRTYMDSPDHSAYDYRSLSLLAAADRLQHVKSTVEPAMRRGETVLSDRYYYSCLANLRARGYGNDAWIYEIGTHMIRPDIAFFFDVPVETALARVRSRPAERDRFIDIPLQYRLREEYLQICRINNGVLISTAVSEQESYERVKEEIRKVIKQNERYSI